MKHYSMENTEYSSKTLPTDMELVPLKVGWKSRSEGGFAIWKSRTEPIELQNLVGVGTHGLIYMVVKEIDKSK